MFLTSEYCARPLINFGFVNLVTNIPNLAPKMRKENVER